MQAGYAGGSSVVSDYSYVNSGPPSPPTTEGASVTACHLVRNATGHWQLEFSAIPSSVATVKLLWHVYDYFDDYDLGDYNWEIDIPASSLTNGVYLIPDSQTTNQIGNYGGGFGGAYGFIAYIQPVDINTNAGNLVFAGFLPIDAPCFVDGRQHLKQNLLFSLRAATISQPYNIYGVPGDTNYAESSFFRQAYMAKTWYNGGLAYLAMDDLWPFSLNYHLHQSLYDPNNPGVPSSFVWQTNLVTVPAPAVLDIGDPYWISQGLGNPSDLGASTNSGVFSLSSGTHNLYGLAFETALVNEGGTNDGVYFPPVTVAPGGYTAITNVNCLFSQTADPVLLAGGYYFAPVTTSGTMWPQGAPLNQPVPIPVDPGFASTNQTGLLIAPVGSSTVIGGWAKYPIQGSSPTKYAYLGQYFTNAFQVGTNGIVTTNAVGVLSPYGEFFPTNAGAVALVTMPDIDTGAQGTCTVYAVGMNVDANHDGNMDLSFNGPDETSQANPMKFWINNDYDFSSGSADPFGHDVESQYSANYKDPAITCVRDLEDYSRLWIFGMPPLPAGQGYSVTMSMSAISGNPAINMVNAVETNGGTLYLTDTNTAFAQVADSMGFGYGQKYQTISSANSVTLPANMFTNSGNKYFLFEGAGIGEGQLTMTISQNGNTIAQTSAYLDIHDIEDFYERAVITNNISSSSISNWTSGVEVVQQATSSALGDDTNLIVMVHGINVGNWDWLNDSETVFKRLYWSGFNGHFCTVKWPCNYLTPPSPLTLDVFNLSEAKAYKSSTALTTYLEQLRSRFSGYRLNLYVHSQGNAVVSEAIKNGAPVDNYLLTQGAISDGAYDVGAATYAPFLAQETGTKITPQWQPMGYQGVYTNLTGRIINFYNPNDPVLSVWNEDQIDDKPSGYYSYDGTNCWYTDFFFISHLVTDFQETRSMVSRSRSLSVGQSGPDTAHGVILSGVNLNTQYNFNDAFPADHSAQWTWPIQTTRPYFQQVLTSYQIEPAP